MVSLTELSKQHKVQEEKMDYFLLDISSKTETLDFQAIFGNTNRTIMEIGPGRGELLARLSELNPHNNYLGIELSAKRIITMVKRFSIEKNSNIRLIKAKVDSEFLKYLPGKTLEQVIILHPDPWPKRKHHKNRIISTLFIDELAKVIRKNGELLVSTDDELYAKEIIKCFSVSKHYQSAYREGFSRESFWENLETHFEKKMKKEGYVPYYMKEFCISEHKDG